MRLLRYAVCENPPLFQRVTIHGPNPSRVYFPYVKDDTKNYYLNYNFLAFLNVMYIQGQFENFKKNLVTFI